jgi:hypothetical protein
VGKDKSYGEYLHMTGSHLAAGFMGSSKDIRRKLIRRLPDDDNELRLFVSRRLSARLQEIVAKLEFPDDKPADLGRRFASRIRINPGTTCEYEYDIEIDEGEGIIRFDIFIEHTGKALIDLQRSNIIFEIKDIRTMDVHDVVEKFIPEMDVLQVIME